MKSENLPLDIDKAYCDVPFFLFANCNCQYVSTWIIETTFVSKALKPWQNIKGKENTWHCNTVPEFYNSKCVVLYLVHFMLISVLTLPKFVAYIFV